MKDSQKKPHARNHHATCCISGPLTGQQHPLLMVTGGAPEVSTDPAADVWLLDVDGGVWNEVSEVCNFTTMHTAVDNRVSHSIIMMCHSVITVNYYTLDDAYNVSASAVL